MSASTLIGMGVSTNASSRYYFRSSWHLGTHQQYICHRTVVNEVLVKCQASASEKIKWLLETENKAPFTANEDYLSDYRNKFLKSYREARAPQLRGGNNYLKAEELIARDPHDQALRYMASARAYFQGLHWFLSLASGRLFTTTISHVQAFHGPGTNGNRSGTPAGIGLGSWAPTYSGERSWDHRTR